MLTGGHTPVICISEIPEATLDYFLQRIQSFAVGEDVSDIDNDTISEEIVFITSKDVSTITSGATRPAKAFTSPFLGETIEQVGDWFTANINPLENGYTGFAFIVMDSQTIEDNSCVVVCTLFDELKTVRCDFDVAQLQILSIEFGSQGMNDGYRDLFMETGEVMTKELYDIAIEGRLYVEDGKLKIKE